MDKKRAFEILELDEQATNEEIEERYFLMLRKARARKLEDEADGERWMNEISEAYRYIKKLEIEQHAEQLRPKNKWAERMEYIWEYYKFHIIVTVVILLLAGYFINSIQEGRRNKQLAAMADLHFTFYTEYMVQQTDAMKAKLQEAFPEWDHLIVYNQYAPFDPKTDYDLAMTSKSMINIVFEDTDIYIMDANNFGRAGRFGAFLSLEGEEGKWFDVPEERKWYETRSGEEQSHWFGIDVTANPLWDELGLPEGTKIAGIRYNAKHKENAMRVLYWLVFPDQTPPAEMPLASPETSPAAK